MDSNYVEASKTDLLKYAENLIRILTDWRTRRIVYLRKFPNWFHLSSDYRTENILTSLRIIFYAPVTIQHGTFVQ